MNNSVKAVPMEQMAPLISELVSEGRTAKFTMTGDSMRPFLKHKKNTVVLEKVAPSDVKRLDVVFYRRESGAYVLHRVIKADPEKLTLCGDGQYKIEEGVPRDAVIALLSGYYSDKAPEKFISCKNKGYKLIAAFWVSTRGIRYFFFRVKRRLTQ